VDRYFIGLVSKPPHLPWAVYDCKTNEKVCLCWTEEDAIKIVQALNRLGGLDVN
jgi:hypothetical protein